MKAQVFQFVHRTTYVYESTVTVSHHLLRVTPRQMGRQCRLEHGVETHPGASTLTQRKDYYGNDVVFVTIEGTHRELTVISRGRVAVGPRAIPEPAETPPWETVRGLCHWDRSVPVLEATEFTFDSAHVPRDAVFAEYAAESFLPGRAILEAAMDLSSRVHRDFSYDAEATTVSTPVADLLKLRRGVCQDFAHFTLACLRSLGLPARYVSGYLETVPPPGQDRLAGADASHAWVSVFCPGNGWIDLDPTNDCLASVRYITAGWGRDYADVSPIRGVLLGGGDHRLSVAVDVIPQGTITMRDE